eukprot:scaffold7016_cov31-Cyclotella_meneghiniana.AAC.1
MDPVAELIVEIVTNIVVVLVTPLVMPLVVNIDSWPSAYRFSFPGTQVAGAVGKRVGGDSLGFHDCPPFSQIQLLTSCRVVSAPHGVTR